MGPNIVIDTTMISNIKDNNTDARFLNDNPSVGVDKSSRKKITRKDNLFKRDSSSYDFNTLTAVLSDDNNEQEKFVILCEESIDKNELPENFEQWTVKKKHNHLINNTSKYFPNIPESLRFVLPAIFENGDCGRSASDKPDWLDMEKFRRGQKFINRYLSGVCLSSVISLFQIFAFMDGLKPLIVTQKSNTPYRAFKRYLSTISRVRNWFVDDPWAEGSKAHQDIQAVRKLHSAVRQRLCKNNDNKIDAACEIPQLWCPTFDAINNDFRDACPSPEKLHCPFSMLRVKGVNQGEMSGTQFCFMGMILLYPEKFGLHNPSDEDMEAFCHVWRGLGYLLGIEDKYNFCGGSLQDVRQRSKDFIEHWVKPQLLKATPESEHMARCVFEGMSYFAPIMTYKVSMLSLCDMLNLKMPRLYGHFTLRDKFMYQLYKVLFAYLVRLPGVYPLMNIAFNKLIDKAMNFGLKKHSRLRKRSFNIVPDFTSVAKI